MPRFRPDARPVLGYSISSAIARTLARLRGQHVAVVAHRAATAGLSVNSGERFYLIDRRLQTDSFRVALPAGETERRWLTVEADWWIHDPYLLLSTAPSDARKQLHHDITRTVSAFARISPSPELLAVRRHVEERLRGTTTRTTAGCTWELTAIRADARHVGKPWRAGLDAWLHRCLRDPPVDDPPDGGQTETTNPF
ncbi:hypothetical protein [Amycolatopsis sp. NPDC003676]